MKQPIEPSEIRKGDLIRWEDDRPAGDSNGIGAIEFTAKSDGYEWRENGAHYLLDRPNPVVELPSEPTLGWLTARTSAIGETPRRDLARWHRHEDPDVSIQRNGSSCGIADDWVTDFTPATAVPTAALDELRAGWGGCERTIGAFLAAVDEANS